MNINIIILSHTDTRKIELNRFCVLQEEKRKYIIRIHSFFFFLRYEIEACFDCIHTFYKIAKRNDTLNKAVRSHKTDLVRCETNVYIYQ